MCQTLRLSPHPAAQQSRLAKTNEPLSLGVGYSLGFLRSSGCDFSVPLSAAVESAGLPRKRAGVYLQRRHEHPHRHRPQSAANGHDDGSTDRHAKKDYCYNTFWLPLSVGTPRKNVYAYTDRL